MISESGGIDTRNKAAAVIKIGNDDAKITLEVFGDRPNAENIKRLLEVASTQAVNQVKALN